MTTIKQPRYYALKAYASTGFPKFWDSYKTLTLARQWANQAIKDGYHTVEIMRDQPRKPGYVGIERELIETLNA
jgi:hypothetical protein